MCFCVRVCVCVLACEYVLACVLCGKCECVKISVENLCGWDMCTGMGGGVGNVLPF